MSLGCFQSSIFISEIFRKLIEANLEKVNQTYGDQFPRGVPQIPVLNMPFLLEDGIDHLLKNSGYETCWTGKWHFSKGLPKEVKGGDSSRAAAWSREIKAGMTQNYYKSRKNGELPFSEDVAVEEFGKFLAVKYRFVGFFMVLFLGTESFLYITKFSYLLGFKEILISRLLVCIMHIMTVYFQWMARIYSEKHNKQHHVTAAFFLSVMIHAVWNYGL